MHLKTIADTSIKRTFSIQSTPMQKKLYLHMFDIIDIASSYKKRIDRLLIAVGFL